MNQPRLALATLAALALAACQQRTDETNIAIDNNINAAEAAEADIEALPPSETGGEVADNGGTLNEADEAGSELPSPPGTPEASMIPSHYRGRWGLVAADCDQRRRDAKGALTISERTMRFYESTATLREQRPAIATSFSGLFAFTGEGQNWQRVVTLTRTGDTLRRADDEGSFSYQRCT